MGLNVNLAYMLGLPDEVVCPSCKETIPTNFDDCDIESPNTNPKTGIWSFGMYCHECEYEWRTAYRVATEKLGDWQYEDNMEACTRDGGCKRANDHPGECCTSNLDTWEFSLNHEDWKRWPFGTFPGHNRSHTVGR